MSQNGLYNRRHCGCQAGHCGQRQEAGVAWFLRRLTQRPLIKRPEQNKTSH